MLNGPLININVLFAINTAILFFTKILAEVTGTVLNVNLKEAQLPILATIDIVDNCNLSCMTCSREAFANSSGRMDIALFRRILDKLELMGIKQVELYNYTEPFYIQTYTNLLKK